MASLGTVASLGLGAVTGILSGLCLVGLGIVAQRLAAPRKEEKGHYHKPEHGRWP